MLLKYILSLALLGAAIAWPLTASAQSPAATAAAQPQKPEPGVVELRQLANAAYGRQDYAAFRQYLSALHELRPYNSSYMSLLVVANALLNDRPGAYNMMLKMQQQGLSHDFRESSEVASIRGTEVFDYVNDLMVRAAEPAGSAELMFDLPAELLLATSFAWDPSRNAYLVGDAREGAVHAVDSEGQVTRLLVSNADNGLWAIFGLAVDADNNRLWVASGVSDSHVAYEPVDEGRSALFEFELDTLELVKRYPVPVDGRPHRLGDLVITGSGDVYVADTILPVIYRRQAGSDRLQPYVGSADMVSMRGMDLSDDDRMLFVADYELGIMAIDLQENRAFKLGAPENLNLGGIEGLFYWDGHLVIIQNSINPQRIMRLKLNPQRNAVEEVAPLAVAQPFFDYPNFGVMRDQELVFLANSHWVRNLESPSPIRVAKTNVAAPPNLMDVDMQKFMEEYSKRPAIAPVNPAPQTAPPKPKD